MKPQPLFAFSPEEKQTIKDAIKSYFLDELDMEIGDLQAELFVEFLSQTIGKHFYNLGVTEVIKALKEKTDDLLLLIKD